MSRHRRPHPTRRPGRWTLGVGAAALAFLTIGTSGTLSGWAAGSVVNDATTAGTESLAFQHTYASTSCSQSSRTAGAVSCAGSIAPASATSASGGVSGTDAITDNGTYASGRLQADVRATSCGPVRLDNRKTASNPLLARYGTTFHTSGGPMDSAGYVTLDGAAPGGYATAVVQQAQPPTGALAAGTASGVGVWFKAGAGTTGPLLSFSASASNSTAVNDDRALYLDGNGKLNLVWNTSGSTIGPSSNAGSLADGAWHFAYATFGGINVAIIGLIPQVTLWVDGVQVATTPLLSLAPLSSYNGYWHLGWAPTSVTGLAKAYGGMSLSNLVVINSSSAPAGNTIGKPATQAAFNTATSASTEHWLLGDSGTTTFAGTLPASMTAPCSMVNLAWSTTSPASTVVASATLTAFADGSWRSIAVPGPGVTQTSTITTTRAGGYNTDVAGLRLYVPISYRVQTLPLGGSWLQTFTWDTADGSFLG